MTDADAVRSVGVVIVAAGSGSRLGAEVPKAFVDLAGDTLLGRAVRTAGRVASLVRLVVVVPRELVDRAGSIVARGNDADTRITVVAGGAERTDSVRAGLAALPAELDIILVHDAARCLTPIEVFERVIDAVAGGAAGAVPGVPVIDTVKTVDDRGVITGTPHRSNLRAIQTPQGFAAAVLREAYGTGAIGTDDAALVELLGHDVLVVAGDRLAFKITTAEDLERAARVIAQRVIAEHDVAEHNSEESG